jgi:hypothetical protein
MRHASGDPVASDTVLARGMAWQGQPSSIAVDLPPLGVLWLASRRPGDAR